MICSAALAAYTTASSKLLDAKRFAPCIPVHATSPIANKRGKISPLSLTKGRPISSTGKPPTA